MRSVSPWHALAAVLLVAAVVCGVVSAITWEDIGIEGAYLNRSVGVPAYSGVFAYNGNTGGGLFLGAAIGLGVAAALVLVVSLSVARRQAPAPPAAAADPGP
ncbi:MAG: hypothetical protein QOI80_3819 [Solirubrobacteraceae bacterium]|nr:hypothetical protein [Solirubrobacteraceae bacterium]